MGVLDWLSNMRPPDTADPFNVVSLRFKNGRKEFYRNTKGLQLQLGEAVVVAGHPGYDIGTVSLTGALVRVQLRSKGTDPHSPDLPQIYRKALAADLERWHSARAREQQTMLESRVIASGLKLEMKISDVEFQADGTRATFYYTAEGRVDFRELIRQLADRFGIRVEMKQIGYRQEAARLGGLGSCGRELCCSTWLSDFRSVTTTAARYQQLAINSQKLAGQCGKLKCCLNYELDTYLQDLKRFPDTQLTLRTQKGKAIFQKLDVFQQCLWYSYESEPSKRIKLSLQAANDIVAQNEAGKEVAALEAFAEREEQAPREFEDAFGLDEIEPDTRMKRPNSKRRKKSHNWKKSNPTDDKSR